MNNPLDDFHITQKATPSYRDIYPSIRMPWPLTRVALVTVRPLGALCALFSLLIIGGYLANVEAFYRPIPNGPATNPLTAICFILIGSGTALGCSLHFMWIKRLLASLAVLIVSLRLLDILTGSEICTLITPFQSNIVQQMQSGKSNVMSANTALMLFLISLSLLFSTLHKLYLSQLMSFLSLSMPMLSLTGYIYGVDQFYGQMSLITTNIGLLLAIATLNMSAHRGAYRALLSPYIGGRIARFQVTLGYLIPFSLGYLLINMHIINRSESLFGAFVICVIWFIIVLVCLSAIMQERVDHKRRVAERALAHSAMNDPLTDLPNRRMFFEVGTHEMERIQRTGSELWLLMLDVDYFKKINDTAGHAMGDQVLLALSQQITSSIRSVDIAARIGGEEFAILLADTSLAGIQRVAESVRHNIEQLEINGWTDTHGPITISIGGARASNRSNLDEALQAADKALYSAKAKGRNCVVLETDTG